LVIGLLYINISNISPVAKDLLLSDNAPMRVRLDTVPTVEAGATADAIGVDDPFNLTSVLTDGSQIKNNTLSPVGLVNIALSSPNEVLGLVET
jgi:hypothetical protein